MKFLLDTCIISELIKSKPNKRVVSWIRKHDEENYYLSVLTLGEIQKGIEKVQDIERKKTLHLWVEHDLRERFRNKILAIDTKVAMIWGQIQGKAETLGKPMPTLDGLIAATALAYNLMVATRNISDMKQSGVALINPWK